MFTIDRRSFTIGAAAAADIVALTPAAMPSGLGHVRPRSLTFEVSANYLHEWLAWFPVPLGAEYDDYFQVKWMCDQLVPNDPLPSAMKNGYEQSGRSMRETYLQ